MPKGGVRPGAGTKKGRKQATTLEKERVLAEIRQRTMRNADKLFNAQFANAVGAIQIFEVVESEDDKGKKKVEHILVTDPDRIKKVLDEGEGTNCSVEGGFYIVMESRPETKAIDSMLDRTFGKAAQTVEITTESDQNSIANKLAQILVQKHNFKPEQAIKAAAKEYHIPPEQIIITESVNN